ncbi:hypothetical protein KDA_62370 [Dictyobacter alpinus]|uniref:VOC domain-containing protein n=1 Tax=Dictyobacter alpinus TaxID=2014873 RepID=A0A402BH99_9CHLR|nr:VOC family protein [Dictyobacter alpinus]GCE30753.1 hypothetical protein KDA_62370 [Dictyobacter alpinus]
MKSEKQQFNVYLTPETVKGMKHRSVDEQLSLSDLVEQVFSAYLSNGQENQGLDSHPKADEATIRLQPMLHVDDMSKAVDFFRQLGATLQNGSRDGDWSLLSFGAAELSLLAHPANPEQNEDKLELNFEYTGALEELEKNLRQAGTSIVRPTGDEGFGYQLQVEGPDGMLIKINQLDPDLYR